MSHRHPHLSAWVRRVRAGFDQAPILQPGQRPLDRPTRLSGRPRQRVDGRLDPRVREHVEEHGSPAHGYDHAPDQSEPADFGGGESTGVQDL